LLGATISAQRLEPGVVGAFAFMAASTVSTDAFMLDLGNEEHVNERDGGAFTRWGENGEW
jgi:hypothetical protein